MLACPRKFKHGSLGHATWLWRHPASKDADIIDSASGYNQLASPETEEEKKARAKLQDSAGKSGFVPNTGCIDVIGAMKKLAKPRSTINLFECPVVLHPGYFWVKTSLYDMHRGWQGHLRQTATCAHDAYDICNVSQMALHRGAIIRGLSQSHSSGLSLSAYRNTLYAGKALVRPGWANFRGNPGSLMRFSSHEAGWIVGCEGDEGEEQYRASKAQAMAWGFTGKVTLAA